jgi:hypothetical protein
MIPKAAYLLLQAQMWQHYIKIRITMCILFKLPPPLLQFTIFEKLGITLLKIKEHDFMI